ncbi:phosphopantetheine-binding protein [Streptomyces venezuelae]|uniref:phosphopantetheine-binding protein n=1 Tax=Streptomyces venezuelae TaxID=54571 RepID=UPI00278BB410|nr:phosphopantetheine-binding protein [Streptomyces venezuelae]
MNAITRDTFDQEFRTFLSTFELDVDLTTVTADDNLFDQGVLDSFSVLKVIVLVERLRGEPVDLEHAGIESFASISTIYESFLAR